MIIFVDLYFLCVDFMIQLANATGTTYRDVNIIVLFGLIPVVLIFDFLLVIVAFLKRFVNKVIY
jgi:hypothetical protein